MKFEALDISELKPKRTITEAYKIIPDNVYTKKFIPLTPSTLWTLQFIDWEEFELILKEGISEEEGRLFAKRMDDGIALEKALEEGKITRKVETMVYWGFPPNLTIRADLHSSSSVMIYGPSHDISFLAINDITREIVLCFNIHMEQGFPVDWWWASGDDEIFNRRHMKLGYRLRDMPQKFDDIAIAASRVRDLMMDIRNERTPQWARSSYGVSLVFVLIGMSTGFSNWNAISQIYDGVNARNIYNLPHSLFLYEPWPPILNSLFSLSRQDWLISLSRMLSGNQLYFQPEDEEIMAYVKKRYPEEYDRMMLISSYSLKKIGVPLPSQLLNAIPPKFNPNTGEWETLEYQYPSGPRVFYDEIGLSFEEALSGVLFNITHKSKIEKVTHDHIISIGHGLNTKYLKPEGWIEEEKRKRRAKKKIKKIKKVIKYKKSL